MLDEDDTLAELRALRNPSSRRGQTSITHLLNYSVPRPFHDHNHHARSYRRHPTWGPGSGHHAADKARYVHANYRFVVSPQGAYSLNAADADLFLDWSDVLQVIASAESQSASCPICLSDPVAPRMAKCGHIFCFSCLIRFMNSAVNDDDLKSGKGYKWRKCPICEDSIYLHEVRPVRFHAGQESPLPRNGDDVVLRLMVRNASSTLALPREGASEVLNSGHDVPWHFEANALDYARIVKGTSEYMAGQFNEEIEMMLQQAREDEALFGQDGEWTHKAIKEVNAAEEKTSCFGSIEEASAISGLTPTKQSLIADYYFYSALPHLYLSPLDIRILKTKFETFSSFPATLLPRVEHISTGHVVDDTLRKRARYLGHLPYGCVISFLECDWTDIIPADILATFAGEIERRRNRNREKNAQEERERVQSERLEAAALRNMTGSQRPLPSLDEDDVSRMDLSDFQPLNAPSSTTPPDARSGFSTLASMSTNPSTQRTVWGTPALLTSPMTEAPSSAAIDDGWLKTEELLDLAPGELALQLEAFQTLEIDHNLHQHNDSNAGGGAGAGAGGKKKKKQKITLMSTGGRRGV